MHKSLSRFFVLALAVMALIMLVGSVAASPYPFPYANGFEDPSDVSAVCCSGDDAMFLVSRVASGTNGTTSAAGSYHAEAPTTASLATGEAIFTRYGGYGSVFPTGGYETSIDIYLDMAESPIGVDKRLDWSSAINQPSGDHRRDFIFSIGTDTLGNFIMSASNNAPGWPANPARNPYTIATTGWYTFRHVFYDDGNGILAVDMSVLDENGTVLETWTLSDPSDEIGVTVGGNRYGWLVNNAFDSLPIDNVTRSGGDLPSVTPVGDTEICDPGTVDIQIDDVEGLYGYEFIVTYNDSLVNATGSFENGWFDPVPSNGFEGPAGWKAECSAGECKFAYTRGAPDGEVSTTTPETIASIQFTPTLTGAAGSFDVDVTAVKLTDKDSYEIPGAVGGSLTVDVCGATTVSGQISLQGRPQPGRPQISGLAPSVFEVKMVGPYGTFTAAPSAVDGTYTVTGVPYLLSGTAYTISASHSVYIEAEKALNVTGLLTGEDVTLLGGDATDNGAIGPGDLACVGNQFGATGGHPYTCSGGETTPDLNDDTFVNIQDLSLVGGNYGITPVPQPWP